MVNLARIGFASHQNPLRKEFQNEQLKQSGESSTASALVSLQKPAGHISKFCNVKNQLKCPKCNNHHFELMCPEPRKINEPKSFVPKSENSLSNCSRSETVFLQTLCVLIRCQGQEKIIRAVIDTGSQSSYVSQRIMTQLKAFPLRTETVIHALFGGDETEPKSHKVFAIEVSSFNRVFSCGFEAFSVKKICGFIPRIENDEILNELKRKKIVFADFFREETDINLLIGSDVLGKLLTGNTVVLECGLTAVETKLGWTVQN
ncbi:DUF1758 domain-containing protein [Nephila pilipes]|uniref:DUF1758 domain-containing protein n=1 Tax=Nephila pilipes TaxID=299642 RepID=A0A8X6TUJ5_NEPPI|nr:DUF1758 domain-containing protein [Nephila pilipes]